MSCHAYCKGLSLDRFSKGQKLLEIILYIIQLCVVVICGGWDEYQVGSNRLPIKSEEPQHVTPYY